MNLLQLENVHKKFGDFTAVSNISFSIEKGSIYGLLGPNGAGKTTTLRMIMDIIALDAGSITFSGNRHIRDFLDQIGYLPEERGLYRKMKVRDVILFIKLRCQNPCFSGGCRNRLCGKDEIVIFHLTFFVKKCIMIVSGWQALSALPLGNVPASH